MKKILSLILCLALMASMMACGVTPEPEEMPEMADSAPVEPEVPEEPVVEEPEPTAAERYADAISAVEEKTDLTLEISLTQKMVLGTDTFEETQEETIVLQGIGTENMKASMTGSYANGNKYNVKSNEVFLEGMLYGQQMKDTYRSEMTAEEYLAQQIPAVLLDAALYETVEETDGILVFSGAAAPEEWLDSPYLIFDLAEGTAVLDETGNLTESTYHAEYLNGAADMTLDVTVRIGDGSNETIAIPEGGESYPLLEDAYIVGIMHTIKGYMLQAESITTSYSITTVMQGAAYAAVEQNSIDAWGNESEQSMRSKYEIVGIDLKGNQTDSYSEELIFHDGTYTYLVDGEDAESGPYTEHSSLHQTAEESVKNILNFITNLEKVTATVLGDTILLEVDLSDEDAMEMIDSVLDTFLVDPDGYRAQSSETKVESASASIVVDASTLMPIGAALNAEVSHALPDGTFSTSVSYQQSILLGSRSSYEAITGEPLPVEEPEEKPTPLFYHVTGENGEEMWLLGTIHVGDERNLYLPQEVYDAFDAADALALEFESEAFLEQAEDDEATMEAIVQAYLYTDGTTLQDHITDEVLYENVLKLLKATGLYNETMLVYKPYFLSQLLDLYFMDHGYALSSEFGVDFLLEERANEQGKTILSVESGLSQIQMLSDFSDELQEQLLKQSVEYGHVYSNLATRELYEMWCDGDETTMIAYLAVDQADMTEEEKQLSDEYNQVVSADRDAQMLEVAKGYLTSGDVVFYAVGLAHLLAETGLVNTLRDAGYTVELVTFG